MRARRFVVTNRMSLGYLLANRVNPLRRWLGIYPVIPLCLSVGPWGLTKVGFSWVAGSDVSVTAWSSSSQQALVFGQSQQTQIWCRFSREPRLSGFGNHTSRLNLICLNRQLVSQQELV